MKASLLFMAAAFILSSCSKMAKSIIDKGTSGHQDQFTTYLIKKGYHYSDGSQYKTIGNDEMKFVVVFDSSVIYRSALPENQYDINKLFGFSDNGTDHHQYSARFGWRWSDQALRLFAYVYNNGKVESKEIGAVKIGDEINCVIRINASNYVFIMNDLIIQMPRQSAGSKATGYQLYPYFGGDETAPHDIKIRIRQIH